MDISGQESLRKKITVAVIVFLVFLVIPLCVGIMYYNTGVALKQQISSQLQSEEGLAVSAIQVKLNHLADIASSLAKLPQVVTAITDGKWDNAAAITRDAQNNVSFYDPYIDRVVLFDRTGTEQAAYPALANGIGANASSTDWFAAVMKTNNVEVSSVARRQAIPSLNVIVIAAPIRNNGALLGVLALQIPANNFLDFSYALSTGTYGFTYVVDQKGNVVAHPKYANVGIVNLASVTPIKEILAGQSGEAITNDPAEGQKNLLIYTTIPEYNWGIVIEEPYDEAFASYDSMIHTMAVVETILVIIDLLVGYLVFELIGKKRTANQEK